MATPESIMLAGEKSNLLAINTIKAAVDKEKNKAQNISVGPTRLVGIAGATRTAG